MVESDNPLGDLIIDTHKIRELSKQVEDCERRLDDIRISDCQMSKKIALLSLMYN